MDLNEYLEIRLEDQINWYDNKSLYNQKWLRFLRICEIIFAASIPFLTGHITSDTLLLKLVVGLFGLLIVVITSVIGFCKFHENWIEYRTTCEALRHEKYLFLTKCGIYKTIDEPFCLLVQRVEDLISKEHSSWKDYMKEKVQKETKQLLQDGTSNQEKK